MANVWLSVLNKAGKDGDLIEAEVRKYQKDLERIPWAYDAVLQVTSEGKRLKYTLLVKAESGEVLLEAERRVYDFGNGSKVAENYLLEVHPDLQGKGLTGFIHRWSMSVADALGAKKITLDANLTMGGYVWLRKGFWPYDGLDGINEIIQTGVQNGWLSDDLYDKWQRLGLTDETAKDFVLSPAFREFKPAFAGSSWKGAGVIADPRFKRAYLGEEPTQTLGQRLRTGNLNITPTTPAMEAYRDAVIHHQIELRRYSAGVQQDVADMLEEADREVASRLRLALEATNADPEAYSVHRLKAIAQDIAIYREATLGNVSAELTTEMVRFADLSGRAELSILSQSVPVEYTFAALAAEKAAAIVTSKPFQGNILSGWFSNLAQQDGERLDRAIKLGMSTGETIQQIVRRVVGTKKEGYTDGILTTTRRDANAIVRTAVTHVSASAREAVWDANADVIDAKVWLSTLDGRTSIGCMGRDHHGVSLSGKPLPDGILPLTPPDIRPPSHFNCRSTLYALINGLALLGDRPSVVDTRTRARREVDFQAIAKQEGKSIQQVRREWAEKNISQVPAKTTYQEFLQRQSPEFQDEVLGPARGRLFREGGLTVDKFSDASGRLLTLDELDRKYPQAPVDSKPAPR